MNNKFIKNTSWIISGHIVRMIISFAVGLFTARYLGPSNYGLINYVSSYIVFFTSIIGLGINCVIVNEFVNNKDNEGEILGTAVFMRFILGLICSFAVILFLNVRYDGDSTIRAIAILQSIQLPFLCLDTIQYWYQARLQSKFTVISQTIAYILTSVYKIVLLVTGKGVVWFAFATSLDCIVLSLGFYIIFTRQPHQKLRVSLATAKGLLKKCFPFLLTSLMIVIYGQMDKIMLKEITGSDNLVGLYSVAVIVSSLIAFIPNAIIESSRPLVFKANSNSKEEFVNKFKLMSAAVLWICIIYSTIVCLFSKIIISVLYGQDYIAANMCLKICVWYTAFSYIGSAKSIWLIAENKNKYVFIFAMLGAAVNLTLNFALIPFMGINGAALATLITQLFTNVLSPLIFRETREYSKLIFGALSLKGINVRQLFSIILKKKS